MTDLEKYLKEVKERCEKAANSLDTEEWITEDISRLVEMVTLVFNNEYEIDHPELFEHLNKLARGDK